MNISKKMQDAFNVQITAELYSSNVCMSLLLCPEINHCALNVEVEDVVEWLQPLT